MTGGDPHTSKGAGAMAICNLIDEGLVRTTQEGKIAPALAKSWEVSKDGLSIKFVLDERAKFHNGAPVTAEDVKFSIERSMKPEIKFVLGPGSRKVRQQNRGCGRPPSHRAFEISVPGGVGVEYADALR